MIEKKDVIAIIDKRLDIENTSRFYAKDANDAIALASADTAILCCMTLKASIEALEDKPNYEIIEQKMDMREMLSKRDQIAAMAMQGRLSTHTNMSNVETDRLITNSILFADALIKKLDIK